MDPLSQATIAAAAAQSVTKKTDLARIGLIGAFAGMADSMLFSRQRICSCSWHHRQFTHSLVFIPFGGLCAQSRSGLCRHHMNFRAIWLIALAGYATMVCSTRALPTERYRSGHFLMHALRGIPFQLSTRCSPSLIRVCHCSGGKIPAHRSPGHSPAGFYLSIGVIQEERAFAAGKHRIREDMLPL